jgi:Concanavalin A-like lectin/glucanases superfamily
MRLLAGPLVATVCIMLTDPDAAASQGYSLRFFGFGAGDVDRVKIRIDAPEVPADVGATDFTVEWWMKANPGENSAQAIAPGGDAWINGNIILDRDIYGNGDYGDFGVSLGAGRLAFGVGTAAGGHTIVGARHVADGQWHHVAVARRRSDGWMQIYVDGSLDVEGDGPDGDASYRNGRATSWPASDPFLVIGAEKHDAGPAYPSYRGWLDELRLSAALRYTAPFPRPIAPFVTDVATVALYHFDEGAGDLVIDSSGAAVGPSHGTRRTGGAPAGPEWSTDTPPFGAGTPPNAPQNLRIIR